MKLIRNIIREEVGSFLKENDEAMYELYDATDNIRIELFHDFLYENNQDFTKNITWQVVPYARLKKVWEDYMKMGTVRDVKSLEYIERLVIRCALRIHIITELAGHTHGGNSEEDMEENIGYWVNEQLNCILPINTADRNQLEIPYNNPEAGFKEKDYSGNECSTQIHPFAQNYINQNYNPDNMDREDAKNMLFVAMETEFFDYYLTDPKSGHLYISDYGLTPIMTQTSKLYSENDPNKKIILIDSILNIAHQRSDLASWFVQGGSAALSDLSGYEVPDEEKGGYGTKSAISGRYNMSDYR